MASPGPLSWRPSSSVVAGPFGAERTGFSATITIRRAAFGVDIQLGSSAGNVVVADTIEIEFTASGSDLR